VAEDDPHQPARRAAELAARHSYGRLVASLARGTRDIAAAEDALADALAVALEVWPQRGVPQSPEAWLLTTARRTLSHGERHARVRSDATATLVAQLEERASRKGWSRGDERLELLFVCAHPAIDPASRTPLMLQTVLGLDAERIASAFLVAPATMGQRLVRAKTRIRDAGVRFEVPPPGELPERLDDVLRAIYVAYGAGWSDVEEGRGLSEEAIFLARLVVQSLPGEPEARGLLALMLFTHARRQARRDEAGRFVPLPQQDPRRWVRPLIIEAEALLTEASAAGRFGRFQCEAAIQSVHAQRAITGVLPHHALRTLYDLLLERAPSVGVAVSRAAAILDAGDVAAARDALGQLEADEVDGYQPYWVTRARLAELEGRPAQVRTALQRALGLTEDLAVRRFLEAWLGRST
jgi:RNA polymerase sigma-70 factor (ECF subfamily)